MPARDHHSANDYDDVTQVKLDIFGRYINDWLPTFVMEARDKVVYIVDYFAGPGGTDKKGVRSTPSLIMEAVAKQHTNALASGVKVRLILNEYDADKAVRLKDFVEEWLALLGADQKIFDDIEVTNLDFVDAFEHTLAKIGTSPSLQLLDQNGVKFGSEDIVRRLCSLTRVDFLIFMSSQTIARFAKAPEVRKNFPAMAETLDRQPAQILHQALANGYRLHVCPDRAFTSFALRRGGNYYGIIFSSEHPRGIDKFLKIAWALDPKTGEANFVIESEKKAGNIDLFTQEVSLTKIQVFEQDLLNWIHQSKSVTNTQVFHFTQDRAFTNSHSDPALKAAKKRGEVTFPGPSPKTRYETTLGKKQETVTITSTQ